MITLNHTEVLLVKRSIERFLEVTKRDCPEMPMAIEVHRKFSDLTGEYSIVLEKEDLSGIESLKKWNPSDVR